MENSEHTSAELEGITKQKPKPIVVIIALIVFTLVIVIAWQLLSTNKAALKPNTSNESTQKVSVTPLLEEPDASIEETATTSLEIEPSIPESTDTEESFVNDTPLVEPLLPNLDESDVWVQQKIPELTWRNELISLIITEDMIRRFVVFTDNFAQGLLAYEHSPFVKPNERMSLDETKTVEGQTAVWAWDNKTSQRFNVYVDLLRSVNSTTLVNSYFEAKPLINEAYRELGYEGDFTVVLQDAINRVLDMEIPNTPMNLTRTSVMYKYNNAELEALADSDKFLLRIGKENLLIIKSLLLEINEKLAVKNNQ
jgi:hypothetical protein